MTDYTNLMDDFPEINPANYGDDDVNALNAWGIAAHTAIESLQAENERLKQEATKYKNEYCSSHAALEIVKVQREALQAENERLTRQWAEWSDSLDSVMKQRNALQAKLGALQTQEPVAYWVPKAEQFCIADKSGRPFAKAWQPLYAAPKALEPLERVAECAARLVEHADFQLGGILSADSKAKDIPSKAVSQVKSRHLAALRDALASHGITKGTP